MKQCPETPVLEEAADFSGHLWVQELPTGGAFRFQVAASGLVSFATGQRSFDAVDAVPLPYRRAAQSITEQLDREALQAATDDPGDVTFCGVATRNEGVEYDWDAVPPFVGTDVWSGRTDQFLPPDSATGVFERLGLPTGPAIEKERPAAHADLARFEDAAGFPQSAWRAGTAAGVLIRDKSGGRAVAWSGEREESQPAPEHRSAVELADAYATDDRIEQTISALREGGSSLTVDSIRERLVADVVRESYLDLFSDGECIAALPAFRSAVAERVQRHRSTTE